MQALMTSELTFRIAQALVFVAFIAHRAYYTRKYPPREQDTIEVKRSGAAARLAAGLSLLGLLALVVYLAAPRWLAWAALPLPAWLRWLGVGAALGGFALLQWSHNELGRNWSDQPRMLQDQEFIRSGPYRRIRHPIYSAFLLILGSPLLIAANWLVGGLWLVSAALDIGERIRFEEQRMADQFGEAYQAYRKSTGALWPRF